MYLLECCVSFMRRSRLNAQLLILSFSFSQSLASRKDQLTRGTCVARDWDLCGVGFLSFVFFCSVRVRLPCLGAVPACAFLLSLVNPDTLPNFRFALCSCARCDTKPPWCCHDSVHDDAHVCHAHGYLSRYIINFSSGVRSSAWHSAHVHDVNRV